MQTGRFGNRDFREAAAAHGSLKGGDQALGAGAWGSAHSPYIRGDT